ncbi:MAG: DUF6389 family protein [Paracoccaceae bacterium]
MTDPVAYAAALRALLDEHAADIRKRLLAIDKALPEKAAGMMIIVHLPQDPDGSFSIMAHLRGPDLYVLNKAIDPHRDLFMIRSVARPSEPIAPMFDELELPFAVNDVLADTVIVWLQGLWPTVEADFRGICVEAVAEDDYGAQGVVMLHPSTGR